MYMGIYILMGMVLCIAIIDIACPKSNYKTNNNKNSIKGSDFARMPRFKKRGVA